MNFLEMNLDDLKTVWWSNNKLHYIAPVWPGGGSLTLKYSMIVREQSQMSATLSIDPSPTTMRTTEEPLPGKTWVVLADEEGGYNVTLPLGFGKQNI